MIQRIQSLYLLLTTLLPFLFLKGTILSILNNNGSGFTLTLHGIFQTTGEQVSELTAKPLILQLILILITVSSVIAISLFRKRRLQKKMAFIVMILAVALAGVIIYYIISLSSETYASLTPGYRMFLPLIILLFAFLAYMGIRKDEDLVKSYERLR